MVIREWQESDLAEIKRIHRAMRVGYTLPNVNGPLFFAKRIAEEDGRIAGAGMVKLIGETFLFLDPKMSKQIRGVATVLLASSLRPFAAKAGLDEASAWIPPHVEAEFAPALAHMGWVRSPWAAWSVKL